MARACALVALLCCLCHAATGCSAIEAYPPLPAPIEDCANDADDDGDGLVDCEAPSCRDTPACVEHTHRLCTNGRDDDGDGAADVQDPECWPIGHALQQRCASVLGGFRVSSAWNGLTLIPEESGVHADAVVGVDVASGAFPAARSAAQLAGALEGLEASVEVYVPARIPGVDGWDGLTLSLFDATTYRDLSFAFTLVLSPGDLMLDARLSAHSPRNPGGDSAFHEAWAPQETWLTLELVVRDGMLRVHIAGTPDADALAIAVPADFPPARPLAIGASAGIPGATTVSRHPSVSRVTLRRPAYLRCSDGNTGYGGYPGGTTPPFGIDDSAELGGVSSEWLASIAHLPDGSLTGLVYETPAGTSRLVSAHATPEGAWSTADTGLSGVVRRVRFGSTTPWDTAVDGAALAPDGEGGLWAAITRAWSIEVQFLHASDARSPVWQDEGVAHMPEWGPGAMLLQVPPVAYEIEDGVHHLTLLAAGEWAYPELREFHTLPGDPHTWRTAADADPSLQHALDQAAQGRESALDVIRIVSIAGNRVAVVRRWFGPIELWVHVEGVGWSHVEGVSIAPSTEEGAFDADVVMAAELVQDTSDPAWWTGRLFYSGLYDVSRALDAAPAGFGTVRLSFYETYGN